LCRRTRLRRWRRGRLRTRLGAWVSLVGQMMLG
jgi:hypothetical protein